MAITASMVKTTDGTFIPATAYDSELLAELKAGKPYKVEVKQMSNRSYQHHKLFFGGLLPLAYQYWQPTGGLITDVEKKLLESFAKRLEAMHDSGGLFIEFAEEFVQTVAQKRGEKIGAVLQSMEAFRKWLTIEAGYFDVYETPTGIRKEAKSISFANMEQEEFERCYNALINAAIKHIFSGTDDQNVWNQLQGFF